MPDVSPSTPSTRASWGESFRAFYEANAKLSREDFVARHAGAFLLTEANTDPTTWHHARLFRVQPRGGRIALPAAMLSSFEKHATSPIPEAIVVGRLGTSDVVIPDGSVSKRHAQLTRGDQSWWVTDVGSSNGTWLEGAEIPAKKPTRIRRAPAQLAFGDARFTFFTAQTLHEFLVAIRRRNEPDEAPALLPDDDDDGPIARPEDFAGLEKIEVTDGDEAMSRVVSAALSQVMQLADTDVVGTDLRARDEKVLDEAIRGLGSMVAVVARVEAILGTKPDPVVLFSGGPRDEFEQARACLDALRAQTVALRVTLSIGDRQPFELFRRRASS